MFTQSPCSGGLRGPSYKKGCGPDIGTSPVVPEHSPSFPESATKGDTRRRRKPQVIPLDQNAPIPPDSRERFESKIDKSGDCWLWTGATSQFGYGLFTVQREYRKLRWVASRLAWVLENGPIPDGLLVCHRCDNPPCVNPAHLFLGTVHDNNADKMAKGRAWSPRAEANRAKTHCPKGHPYEGENLVIRRNGHRRCRTCRFDMQARWYQRKKAGLVGSAGSALSGDSPLEGYRGLLTRPSRTSVGTAGGAR